MKKIYSMLLSLCVCITMAAQENVEEHQHNEDSTDVFFRHLKLNEFVVTGVTGDTKLKNATAPISIIHPQELRSTAATNIIDAIAHQPGLSQLTTGSGISKPIIRGLGYNRVVVMSEGVRQEGQQWGDEHGVEVDGGAVNSVEILKGPASLMYGSDAMAGVVIMHSQPAPAEGVMRTNVSTEYQTNNGLFGYSLSMAGNQNGFVWDTRFSHKQAHAYKNKYDGYVPGSQFKELAGRLRLGLQKQWGHSWLTWTAYHLTPSIIEGERDEKTGELVRAEGFTDHGYSKSLPYQQVKHYKLVWDNSINLSSGYLKAIVGYQQNRRKEYEKDMDEYDAFFKLHTLSYDLRYLTKEWNGWKLSAGIGGMFQQSLNKGEEALIPEYRLFDFGIYATASKQLNRWTLNGGLRYDHRRVNSDELMDEGKQRFTDLHRHFNGVTGNIGAVWNVSDNLDLRLNVARGFRTPNLSELASNGVHEGSQRYEIGNGQLKAEYSLQADLGLDFRSEYVSAQLALFANRIDNYIFMHRLPKEVKTGYLTYAYTQGDARLMGFEAGIDIHPVHSLHLENTFSYVDARQLHQTDESIRYLPYTPAPRWTSEVKWELAHHSHTTIGHHHSHVVGHHEHDSSGLSLNNVYLSVGIECYLKQNHIYSADDTETPTPSYTLVNLSAGTDIHLKRKKIAEFYITADNLLNCGYQNHLSRLKHADINRVTGRQGVFNMGRNITFKLVIPLSFEL